VLAISRWDIFPRGETVIRVKFASTHPVSVTSCGLKWTLVLGRQPVFPELTARLWDPRSLKTTPAGAPDYGL
jgi:hypothetical protein